MKKWQIVIIKKKIIYKTIGIETNIADILKDIAIKIVLNKWGRYALSLFFSQTKKQSAKHDSLKKLFLPIVNHWMNTGDVKKTNK